MDNANRNNIKLHFREPKFIVVEKNKMVICHLTFDASIPEMIDYAATWHEDNPRYKQTVKAVVFTKKEDEFDINVGKKVALAKAENKAYNYVLNYYKQAKNKLCRALDAYDDFENKVNRVRAHNVEYMKKF